MQIFLGVILTFVVIGVLSVVSWVVWRMAKGHTKLEEARTEIQHKHFWSPWEDHEVGLWDGGKLVRYAPGQLRTCLDPDCGVEDVRVIGGQTTSGENDLG